MKVLVTGSAGFIGRHVVRALLGCGHEVVGYDLRRPGIEETGEVIVTGDLLDAGALSRVFQEHRPDAVIHLAAKTSMKKVPPGSRHFAVNTEGQRHLMDAIRNSGSVRRAIYTSTKYVYRGEPPAPHRTYRPESSYGESKAEMEELIWNEDGGGVEWLVVRPTTIWGPGMGPHYRSFLTLVRSGRYVHLGREKVRKHLGYVENVAAQYVRLLEARSEQIGRRVFHVGDYEPWVVRDWVESFRRALAAPEIRTLPMPMARLAAKTGDILVGCGWRKFPFTTFRLRNLTQDDLCDMEPVSLVCGELPVAPGEAIARTTAWYLDRIGER